MAVHGISTPVVGQLLFELPFLQEGKPKGREHKTQTMFQVLQPLYVSGKGNKTVCCCCYKWMDLNSNSN